MHIFIDESGIFSNPKGRSNVPSCLGALALPTAKLEQIFNNFGRLKNKWGFDNLEIKGSRLDEEQVSAVVEMLIEFGAVFEVSAIDMENHSVSDLDAYKAKTIETMRAGIVEDPEPGALEEALQIISSFEAMSQPLFVQSMIMQSLIPRVFRHSVIYYSRKIPEELTSFQWIIDAKDKKPVEYEGVWPAWVFLTMYSASLDAPFRWPPGGDYSHLDRFYGPVDDDADLIRDRGNDPDELEGLRLEMILGEPHSFENSEQNLGLQLADILVTSTRRALKGTLSAEGWGEIGRLILSEPVDDKLWAIEPVALKYWDGASDRTYRAQNSAHVYEIYLQKARRLLPVLDVSRGPGNKL